MDTEKGKFQYSALKWLYEMELIRDPQLINNLKLNIFSISRYVKEVELLSYEQNRQLLVYVELSWWGRTFYKKQIVGGVQERVNQLLPRFTVRVVTDYAVMKQALENIQRVLKKAQEKQNEEPTSEKPARKPRSSPKSRRGKS